MSRTKTKLMLVSILLMILISLFAGLYFLPIKAADNVTVWFSNHRFKGFNTNDAPDIFIGSKITSGNNGISWSGRGLNTSVYVGNVSFISLADGITMWANDSLGLSNFPVVSENDQTFEDIYFSFSNVQIHASKEGTNPIAIPFFNSEESTNAHAYVDLNQVESILSINGDESYLLSISMVINYHLNVPTPPFLSSNPNKIVEEKTVYFGNITVSCINGSHEYVYVDFPYQAFSCSVEVPYISKLFSLFGCSVQYMQSD